MKFSRKWLLLGVGALLVCVAYADWIPGADDTTAASALESALFRVMGVPDGTVVHARPPWEAKRQVSALLRQPSKQSADMYSLRAQEEELLQQYSEAEADWKAYAEKGQDKIAAQSALEEFYDRRNRPRDEVAALLRLGALAEQTGENAKAVQELPQWKAFTQAVAIARNAQLPVAEEDRIYEQWMQRYPRQLDAYQTYLSVLIARHNLTAAQALAGRMKTAFPDHEGLAVNLDVEIARLKGGDAAALEVYGKEFSPLWPDQLRKAYFAELAAAHQLRVFFTKAQQEAADSPTALAPVERLFFYYQQQEKNEAAEEQLLALSARRLSGNAPWTADELKICAALFVQVQDWDEAAHSYYQLYESSSAADKEFALAKLIGLLLDVPEQGIQFGSRDLSLYRNIAQMDRHPGFLNGILTIALSGASPAERYQTASQNAVTYFHRASAARLMEWMEQKFPRSNQLPDLQTKLFGVYAAYGQHDAIVRDVPAWLEAHRQAAQHVSVALQLADSYAALQNTKAELALYDSLLVDLADRTGHVPIGETGVVGPKEGTAVRPGDYASVLDREVSRLVQIHRPLDAVAVLRREIDRNPDDPGIYERLALFLEQNRLDADLEQIYKQALAKFNDPSWASKLARLYIRKKRNADYLYLTRQVTGTFKGSVLAPFLNGVSPGSPGLYLQVNLYAHQRFPHNLSFVQNLLHAYAEKATRDDAAYAALLREYWFYDDTLRREFFEYLSRTGGLQQQLAQLPPLEKMTADSNLAQLKFAAYGNAWLTHFEGASPAFAKLADMVPGDRKENAQAIAIERSLGSSNSTAFATALRFARQDVEAAPGDRSAISRVGEIFADRELYAQARQWWNRVGSNQPGIPDGYLDSATVFWDYFQFDDALRVIREAQHKLGNPSRFSYEQGAIFENRDQPKEAIAAYIQGAVHGNSDESRSRLLRLADRKQTAALVEQQTANLVKNGFDSAAFQLRLAVLEKENRRGDIQILLSSLTSSAATTLELNELQSAADRLGFDTISAAAMQRVIAMTADPIEKLRAQLDLAHFYEAHNDAAAAEREFSSALAASPNRLGVVRAAVDFHWRNKEPQLAVQILSEAAGRARPPYTVSLRREAAEKATNAGEHERARELLDVLLATDPWNGDLLAEKAQTYARQNDEKELLAFYSRELEGMKQAQLPAPEKTSRTAALRRGYIAALIAIGNNADALEQYQLVMNSYPEDTALISEATRFAEDHSLSDRLLAYYSKATVDAPRDYRWPMVLAHVETVLRRYPEAIASYEKASVVRPDRTDILLAKADLQKRLLRFQDAFQTFDKLYNLSYHDTQYLVEEADLDMRLQKPADALKLLRAAYIEPHPGDASSYLAVMRQELSWKNFATTDRLFREARDVLSGDKVNMPEAVLLESEALASLHKPQDAIETAAASLPAEWPSAAAAAKIGEAAHAYLTPPEKVEFANYIETGRTPPAFSLIDLVRVAGLADVQAELEFRRELSSADAQGWSNLEALQEARLAFAQLGRELEAIAGKRKATDQYAPTMQSAFRAYAQAGDRTAELRLINYAGPQFARLFVQKAGPNLAQSLPRLSAQTANRVIQFLIENGSEQQITDSITSRGRAISPLWADSYLALSGVYRGMPQASTTKAFRSVLGKVTVGAELEDFGKAQYLLGPDWYYYASRFGEYLGYHNNSETRDFLPAVVEENAASSDGYVQLAGSYEDLKDGAREQQALEGALQLSPGRADVYDRLAVLSIRSKQRDQAVQYWRKALQLFTQRVEQGPLPETYWPEVRIVLAHMNQYQLISDLRPQADEMFRTYAHRNGTYRFDELVKGLFDEASDPKQAVDWLLALSRLPNLEGFFNDILQATWIPRAEKAPLYEANVEGQRKAVANAAGAQADFARQELNRALIAFAAYLEEERRWQPAWSVLQQISRPEERPANLLLPAAGMTGNLDSLLNDYAFKPDGAPSNSEILGAATALARAHNDAAALRLREFAYQRDLRAGTAEAGAWFGLAVVRMEQKRGPEALKLIEDVTLTVGAPFENLPEAVRVLDQHGFRKEAAEYATRWVTAEPWSSEAQLEWARLHGDVGRLNAIRTSPAAPYEIRVKAALILRSIGSPSDGGDELALLTHKQVTATEAAKPYFVAARLLAADNASPDERVELYRDAIAIDPGLQPARLQLALAAFRAKRNTLGMIALGSFREDSETGVEAELTEAKELAARLSLASHNYSRAFNFFEWLAVHAADPEKRSGFRKEATAARQFEEIAAASIKRRPIVSEHVSQQYFVRPKVTSWTPALHNPDVPADQGGDE